MARAWIVLIFAAGCFDPRYTSGDLRCAAGECPTGFHCAADDTCWQNGSDPAPADQSLPNRDLSTVVPGHDGAVDLANDLAQPVDLAQPIDLAQNPDLTPVTKHQGDACVSTDTCDTGHCVDGVCCNSSCDGVCQACNLPSTRDFCTTVPVGQPLGIGKSCVTSLAACAGQCDGTGAMACHYPDATTVCARSCASSSSESDRGCDGAGACGAASTTASCTNHLVCAGTGCLTQCAQTSDCLPSYACVGTSCVVACSDGLKDNGETDVDCGGPCPNKCAVNKSCTMGTDCQTGSCASTFCQLVSGPPYWLAGANMPTARAGLAVAVGDDELIYAIGGFASIPVTATEAYNPHTNLWSTGLAALPAYQFDSAYATGYDGKIYVMGGYAASPTLPAPTNVARAYRASTNTWSTVPSLLSARSRFGAAVGLDGHIYVLGGISSSFVQIGANESFSIALGSWSSAAPLPTARQSAGVATGADGNIYVVGGANPTVLGKLEAYNPASNTWSQLAGLSNPRTFAPAVAGPDGRIYFVGGMTSSGGSVAEVDAYTPAINTWTTVPSLTTARSDIGATVGTDGRIYAIGGEVLPSSTAAPVSTVESYGPVPVVTPSSGPKGTLATVAGNNFAANATVSVYWNGLSGTLLGTGITNGGGVLAAPISITIPNVGVASYKLTVVDNRSQYPVTPTFKVTP